MPQTIDRVLAAARHKLLDTGTRNRLIHVNRANLRANCLNVINERSDAIYDLLRQQNKRMRFKAMGKDRVEDADKNDGALDHRKLLALPDPDIPEGSERLTDTIIETPLGPEGLAKRLLRLASHAKTAEEEQGLNILYLAMGFLRWTESASSDVQREAPLVLLPVRLVRNERSSSFDLVCRQDDLTTNLPLQARLRQDFGIILPEVDEDDDWRPSAYFDSVMATTAERNGWSLDPDGMQLGFFSFAKILMHRDLNPEHWPDQAFSSNLILNGLLADGFPASAPLFGPNDKLDDLLDPAQIIQVVDADASQTKVIEEVRNGDSLVVQGPPGTGKSQTITNIIAAAAHDGRSVLFVAEKMAALTVVHQRLLKAGLGDICLELHSRTANKRELSQELGRTLHASASTLPAASDPGQLRLARDELNRIVDVLHLPFPASTDTPFQALSQIIGFMGQGAQPPSIRLAGLDKLGATQRNAALQAISALMQAMKRAGPPASHPFLGIKELGLQPTDLARLAAELNEASSALAAMTDRVSQAARPLALAEPRSFEDIEGLCRALALLGQAPRNISSLAALMFEYADQPRMAEALQIGAQWAAAKKAAEGSFIDSAWQIDASMMRAALAKGQHSWVARVFGGYRRASGQLGSMLSGGLPKAPQDRLALADQLLNLQRLRRELSHEDAWLQLVLGTEWRGERTPFAELLAASHWLAAAKATGAFQKAEDLIACLDALDDPAALSQDLRAMAQSAARTCALPIDRLALDLKEAGLAPKLSLVDLHDLRRSFSHMSAGLSRYADWVGLAHATGEVHAAGAGEIADALDQGRLQPEQALAEFTYACAEARWITARNVLPELAQLQHLDRHDLVALFKQLEIERIDETKHLILARHFQQMPRGTTGEMGIIRGEIARKRGHKPIRWLMKHAGSMVQRVKPVMLMSPISVAQFLPPDGARFDLLVIDEASQIKPEDALGVIARARQIVVVGDQKQLPPTSFFDRLADEQDDDEDDDSLDAVAASAADMESILTLCEARGLRQRMLEWHYRSRDPSLIQVSNAEFYHDGLVLPPSPLQLDPNYGLKFRRVPGVYARGSSGLGRKGTNRIEAEAMVRAIADHARRWPTLSLGVVAFSKVQADMLTEVLELERRQDRDLDAFLRDGKAEDVFVKNIENVQGDERDVIMISVGYGPQEANGRLTNMSFGPINSEGGGRRLNVLFSRARARCEVFASFDPADIDPSRTSHDGPRILKRFLEFAKSGISEIPSPTGLEADSPFEADVIAVVRSLGYLADPQVGTAGFRIDVGVRHPDNPAKYLLAIECDGASYHSALWARERDRLRQAILENLGWRFHRIWSTDWFHDRSHEVERLRLALKQAEDRLTEPAMVNGANDQPRLEAAIHAEDLEDEPLGPDPAASTHPEDLLHLAITVPDYQRAQVKAEVDASMHDLPPQAIRDLVQEIVEIEGPIHEAEIARRLASAFGKSRTGPRIAEASRRAVRSTTGPGSPLIRTGPFVMTFEQQQAPPIRNRSAQSGSVLKASNLAPIEIEAAARLIIEESGSVTPDEMVKAIARLLGFQRTGPDLHSQIASVLFGDDAPN